MRLSFDRNEERIEVNQRISRRDAVADGSGLND